MAGRTCNNVRGCLATAPTTASRSHVVPKIPDSCHPCPTVSDRKAAGHKAFPSIPNNSRSGVVESRPTGQPVRTKPVTCRNSVSAPAIDSAGSRVTLSMAWRIRSSGRARDGCRCRVDRLRTRARDGPSAHFRRLGICPMRPTAPRVGHRPSCCERPSRISAVHRCHLVTPTYCTRRRGLDVPQFGPTIPMCAAAKLSLEQCARPRWPDGQRPSLPRTTHTRGASIHRFRAHPARSTYRWLSEARPC